LRCFDCSKDVTGQEKDSCKEQGHDLDYTNQWDGGPTLSQVREREKAKEPQKNISKLLDFAKKNIVKIIISQNDSSRVYALIKSDDHLETIELGSVSSVSWLKAKYYDEKKEILSDESYKSLIDLIRAKAQFSDKIPRESIHKRIAFVGNEIYYDLCSKKWELVKITCDSVSIVKHGVGTPVFHRSNNQASQIEPNLRFNGDPLEEFCSLIRMSKNTLFKVHLVSFLLEQIPVPVMVIIGQQGSIKSTQSGLMKSIVDPSGDKIEDNLSHFPKTIDDLNIHLLHNSLVAFDNVSYVSDEISDVLCKAITGAGYPKRKYYTDSEETILKFQRKVILNGITVNVDNGDLAERSIQYFTQKVQGISRLTVQEVEAKFKQLLPDVLGQILVILQKSLQNYAQTKEEIKSLPRMADFAIWGESISQSLGNNKGEFLRLYKLAIDQNNDMLNENNPIIPFLEQEMIGKDTMVIPAGQFFESIHAFAQSQHYDTQGRNFPRQANRLRAYLTRSKPMLDENNLTVEIYKNTENPNFTKNATLIRVRKTSSPQSLHSPIESASQE